MKTTYVHVLLAPDDGPVGSPQQEASNDDEALSGCVILTENGDMLAPEAPIDGDDEMIG